MYKILLILFFNLSLFSEDIGKFLVKKEIDDSFITKYEYGKMLYHNPRGISCAKCHGENGKGKIVATFTHYIKKKKYICTIKPEDITNIPYETFEAKLNPDIKVVKPKFDKSEVCAKLIYGNTMPKYFLTKEELDTIYYYITHIKDSNE
jgi:hypothetical protein